MPDASLDVDGSVDALEAATASEAPVDETYLKLRRLMNRMTHDDRLHRFEQVMPLSPWRARTTQRVFRRNVGVPVKWVLDQPHSINDFPTMLGFTPGEYGVRTHAR